MYLITCLCLHHNQDAYIEKTLISTIIKDTFQLKGITIVRTISFSINGIKKLIVTEREITPQYGMIQEKNI